MRYHLTPVLMTIVKKVKGNEVGNDVDKEEPCTLLVGMHNKLVLPQWKAVWRVLRTLKIEPPYDSFLFWLLINTYFLMCTC